MYRQDAGHEWSTGPAATNGLQILRLYVDANFIQGAVRVALRLGVVMLARGAQARESVTSLLEVMQAFGLKGGEAIVTSSSVTVVLRRTRRCRSPDGDSGDTRLGHDFGLLAAAGALARNIRDGWIGIPEAAIELDQINAMAPPYGPDNFTGRREPQKSKPCVRYAVAPYILEPKTRSRGRGRQRR